MSHGQVKKFLEEIGLRKGDHLTVEYGGVTHSGIFDGYAAGNLYTPQNGIIVKMDDIVLDLASFAIIRKIEREWDGTL